MSKNKKLITEQMFTLETDFQLNNQSKEYLQYLGNIFYAGVTEVLKQPDSTLDTLLKNKNTKKLRDFVRGIVPDGFIVNQRIIDDIIIQVKQVRDSHNQQKEYLLDLYTKKLQNIQKDLVKIKQEVEELKQLACVKNLSYKEFTKLRSKKYKLYRLNNKKQTYTHKIERLNRELTSPPYYQFISKDFLRERNHLEDKKRVIEFNLQTELDTTKRGQLLGELEHVSGSIAKWRVDFNNRKVYKYLYFSGDASMPCGNYHFKVRYTGGNFSYTLLKAGKYKGTMRKDRHITGEFQISKYNSLRDRYLSVLQNNNQAISYRYVIKDGKGKLQITFKIINSGKDFSVSKGVHSIDYNYGCVSVSELDRYGNLVDVRTYKLPKKGDSELSSRELSIVLSKIVNRAKTTGKPIIIEDLDFRGKKAGLTVDSGYNSMISVFDYSRYTRYIESKCVKSGVLLYKVNPYNTSKDAKRLYCERMKLTSHEGASYVIGRRGMGYKER